MENLAQKSKTNLEVSFCWRTFCYYCLHAIFNHSDAKLILISPNKVQSCFWKASSCISVKCNHCATLTLRNQGVPKIYFFKFVSWMSSAGISGLRYKVELLRELPRSKSGMPAKINKELILGFSIWQSGPSINQVSIWKSRTCVNCRLPGVCLCSVCIVSVHVVMFCFPHKVTVSWLCTFAHAGQGGYPLKKR